MAADFVGDDMTEWGSYGAGDCTGAMSSDRGRFRFEGCGMRSGYLGRLDLLGGGANQAVSMGKVESFATGSEDNKSADNEAYGLVARIESVTAAKPSAYAMMLAGIGILGFMARRRLNG